MRKILVALCVLAAWSGRADAFGVKVPPGYDPASGQVLPTPARNYLTGAPAPCPKFQPIVGSAERKSHFNNPFTGTAHYRGAALDPTTGRVFSYKFRH